VKKNIYQLIFFGLIFFNTNIYADAPDQTGTGCANGTQYCENNNLNTTNTTTTNNTNTNTNTNNNTNTNTNTNTTTTTATNTNTSTSAATNTNTNVNTSTATNTNVNTTTANSTATTDNTNSNTNVNTSTSTSNSTVNSTVNQNVNNTSTTDNTNTNVNTSTSTSSNTNVNKNESKSESNVQTNNVNQNNNNTKSDNTNRNINESNSTQTINQNIKTKAPPASAIAPSIMSYSQDLCTVGRSGAYQGQVFGISTGRTVTDENCERLKLSKYIYDMGMKVAAVSILCQDTRVFKAMEMAGTPCPYMGKIGKEASEGWNNNPTQRPDAKEYKANWIANCKKGLNPNDTGYNRDVVSGVRKVLTKKTKSTKQCKKEWKNAT
jgi:DNA polymerase III alpha subunit (gram-positive type)